MTRETSFAQHLLILDIEGKRSGVVLDNSDNRFNFVVWKFEEQDPGNWEGLALGPVEVIVDTSSASFSPALRASIGEVASAEGVVYLGARFDRMIGASALQVGTCAAGGTGCASFTRWQLVQRDHLGAPIVLFEHGDKPTV